MITIEKTGFCKDCTLFEPTTFQLEKYGQFGRKIWCVECIHHLACQRTFCQAMQNLDNLEDISNAYENGYQQGKFEALNTEASDV